MSQIEKPTDKRDPSRRVIIEPDTESGMLAVASPNIEDAVSQGIDTLAHAGHYIAEKIGLEKHEPPKQEEKHEDIIESSSEPGLLRKASSIVLDSVSTGYEKVTSSLSHAGHYIVEKIGIPQTLNIETGSMRQKYSHPTYTFVDDPMDADGVAWGFVDHFTAGEFLFKFPEIKPEEIRIDITYFGICHSDTMFM